MKNNKKPMPNSSLFVEQEPATLLSRLLDESDTLFVKKLSLNDRDWARLPNKHQAGVYVPPAERDGGGPRKARHERVRDDGPLPATKLFDRKTGKESWARTVAVGDKDVGRNNMAAPSPVSPVCTKR